MREVLEAVSAVEDIRKDLENGLWPNHDDCRALLSAHDSFAARLDAARIQLSRLRSATDRATIMIGERSIREAVQAMYDALDDTWSSQ